MVTMAETTKLIAALEEIFSRYFDRPCQIASLERHASPYRSSYELEEIVVSMEDGPTLPLLFKNLSWDGLPEYVQKGKPRFLYDPQREIETYRIFLRGGELGTPLYYGATVDEQTQSHWLFIEKVFGKELYQIGEFEHWKEVARWLAKFHSYGANLNGLAQQAEAAHLIQYDGNYYAKWLHRARALHLQNLPSKKTHTAGKHAQDEMDWLLNCYARAIGHLVALPLTLIHGEFYASNVLVQETETGLRVCAVDWEMAALAPGLMDLAALTSGNWSEEQRNNMALAYHAELQVAGLQAKEKWLPAVDEFLTALDYCRLHLAIQWLGWSASWSPPPEHAQDWLQIGLDLAEKLDL
jgi:thiamine kinase-like enzyme